ncbi:MAG: hypothetical protein ABR505_11205 [Actinomycetota bacterium]
MKRLIAVGLIAGLMVGSLGAPVHAQKKKKPRVVEIAYNVPGRGVAPVGGFPVPGSQIPLLPGEKFIRIEVTETTGQKVFGWIGQGDLDGNGMNDDLYGPFCGSHPGPIPIADPKQPIAGIYMYNGVCNDLATPSVMTRGTIKVTLSRRPF